MLSETALVRDPYAGWCERGAPGGVSLLDFSAENPAKTWMAATSAAMTQNEIPAWCLKLAPMGEGRPPTTCAGPPTRFHSAALVNDADGGPIADALAGACFAEARRDRGIQRWPSAPIAATRVAAQPQVVVYPPTSRVFPKIDLMTQRLQTST
jgi:hypothetical protein